MWLIQLLMSIIFSLCFYNSAATSKATLKEIFASSVAAMKSNNEVKIDKHLMKYCFTQDRGK